MPNRTMQIFVMQSGGAGRSPIRSLRNHTRFVFAFTMGSGWLCRLHFCPVGCGLQWMGLSNSCCGYKKALPPTWIINYSHTHHLPPNRPFRSSSTGYEPGDAPKHTPQISIHAYKFAASQHLHLKESNKQKRKTYKHTSKLQVLDTYKLRI
jgi:hypothetical protein